VLQVKTALIVVRVLLMSVAGALLIYYGTHYSDGDFAMVLGALSIAWPQLELFLARRAA